MPIPRIDSILTEFNFLPEETIVARQLSPLQIQWFQTKYAKLFKAKASSIIPEDKIDDRSFLLKIAELEGKLTMLQELFLDHQAALEEYKNLETSMQDGDKDVAARAANLVNQNSQFN